MKPVMQTICNQNETGNCLQAAIASLFEFSLEEVPHFGAYGDMWFYELRKWLWGLNLDAIHVDQGPPPTKFSIMCGPSPRGDSTHAVIGDEHGEIIHDPHPDQTGLAEGKRYWYWFLVKDPARMKDCIKSLIDGI